MSRLSRAVPPRPSKLASAFALVCAALKSPKLSVCVKAKECLSHVLRHCISPALITQALNALAQHSPDFNPFAAGSASASAGAAAAPAPLSSILLSLSSLLTYPYKPVWALCFDLLRVAFEVLPPTAFPLLTPLLQALDSLHAVAQQLLSADPRSGTLEALEVALGAAIKTYGPQRVLQVLPFNAPKLPVDKVFVVLCVMMCCAVLCCDVMEPFTFAVSSFDDMQPNIYLASDPSHHTSTFHALRLAVCIAFHTVCCAVLCCGCAVLCCAVDHRGAGGVACVAHSFAPALHHRHHSLHFLHRVFAAGAGAAGASRSLHRQKVSPLHTRSANGLKKQLQRPPTSASHSLTHTKPVSCYVWCRRSAEAKSCAGLSAQLWECFIAFCAYPTDLGPALKAHASKLGAALSDMKATTLHVVWSAALCCAVLRCAALCSVLTCVVWCGGR